MNFVTSFNLLQLYADPGNNFAACLDFEVVFPMLWFEAVDDHPYLYCSFR